MFFILYYGNFDPESNLLFLDNSYLEITKGLTFKKYTF